MDVSHSSQHLKKKLQIATGVCGEVPRSGYENKMCMQQIIDIHRELGCVVYLLISSAGICHIFCNNKQNMNSSHLTRSRMA